MATASREIEIVIKSKDLASGEIEEIIQKITKIGPKSDDVSKQVVGHSKLMRLGFFSAGEMVESVAGKFGIAGKAGRQLGNAVESMVAGLGSFGVVLGGTAAVVGAGVLIWNRFEEVARKAREEVDKSVSSLSGEVNQLYRNIPATEDYNRALFNTLQFKRDILITDLKTQIKNETEEIEKQTKKLDERAAIETKYSGDVRQDFLQRMGIIPTAEGLNRELNQHKAKLQDAQRELQKLSKPVTFSQFTGEADRAKKDADTVLAVMQEMTNRSELIGLDRDQAELARLDQKHAAEFQKLLDHHASTDQLDSAYSIIRIERANMEAEQITRNEQQIAQNRITVMQGTGQVMGMLYDVTGRKMKAFFILQKAAAASEAFFHYQLAAAKAVGQTGIFGMPMQAYFQAMSYIVPPLIMASAFTGPGGGGGAAATGGIPTVSTGGTEGINAGGGAIRYETNITLNTGAILASSAELQNLVDGYIIPAIDDAASRNITGNA